MSNTTDVIFETLSYGQTIQLIAPRAIEPDAAYEVRMSSPGLQGKSEYYPNNLTSVELAPHHIDPEFKERGALVLRHVPDGMLFTRLKFRAEGGENNIGRSFMLARTTLVPKWQRGHDILFEFLLYFCEKLWEVHELRAEPFHSNTPYDKSKICVELEKWSKIDIDNYIRPTFHQHRHIIQASFNHLLGELPNFQGWGMPLPKQTSSTEPQVEAAFFAEKVILMALYHAANNHRKMRGNWEFNLSVSIGLAQSAGTSDLYFTSQVSQDTLLDHTHLTNGNYSQPTPPGSEEAAETHTSTDQDNPPPRLIEVPKNAYGRRIGKDPIDLSTEGAVA